MDFKASSSWRLAQASADLGSGLAGRGNERTKTKKRKLGFNSRKYCWDLSHKSWKKKWDFTHHSNGVSIEAPRKFGWNWGCHVQHLMRTSAKNGHEKGQVRTELLGSSSLMCFLCTNCSYWFWNIPLCSHMSLSENLVPPIPILSHLDCNLGYVALSNTPHMFYHTVPYQTKWAVLSLDKLNAINDLSFGDGL